MNKIVSSNAFLVHNEMIRGCVLVHNGLIRDRVVVVVRNGILRGRVVHNVVEEDEIRQVLC